MTFFCPMLKANAYGHGAVACAQALVQVGLKSLGVALVEEGLELRESGVMDPQILVFGFFTRESAAICVQHRLTPVIGTDEDLATFAQVAHEQGRTIGIHLKFDTGMHRLGFAKTQIAKLLDLFSRHPQLKLEGVCTHLANGEDLALPSGITQRQMELFAECLAPLQKSQPIVHVYNSAALVSAHLNRLDVPQWGVRPGIALYGAIPEVHHASGRDHGATKIDLKPVFHLRSRIRLLHFLAKGESVSYGPRWTAAKPSCIAVLPVGYGDGYMRILTNRAEALVRGKRVPLVGTVCMDYIMLDVTSLVGEKPLQVGEPVTLWGRQGDAEISPTEVAEKAGTIAYELFTAVSARVPRIYSR